MTRCMYNAGSLVDRHGTVAMRAIMMLDRITARIARMAPNMAISPARTAPISGRKTIA